MQLTARQFANILTSVQNPRELGKRRAPRVEHRSFDVKIVDAKDPLQRPVMVQLRNFSSRGVGIVHAKPMERGDQFVVNLQRDDGLPVAILCTVAHCYGAEKASYNIGAEFTCVLQQNEPHDAGPLGGDERERIQQSILG